VSGGITRKELFHGMLSKLRQAAGGSLAVPVPERLLRPPGARLPDADYLAACTGCEACLPVCPPGALFMASAGEDPTRRVAVLSPERKPCYLCTELPCIAACGPEALRPVAGPAAVRIGLAQVDPLTCRTFRGEACDLCVRICPFPELAIRLVNGRPIVAQQHCTGCGLCVMACPEHPKAVQVVPERDLIPGLRLPLVAPGSARRFERR